jgi:hypothetical protein
VLPASHIILPEGISTAVIHCKLAAPHFTYPVLLLVHSLLIELWQYFDGYWPASEQTHIANIAH